MHDLVEEMTPRKESKKVDALTSVANELVALRNRMHEQVMPMQPETMRHMMEQMRMGMTGGTMESMSAVPQDEEDGGFGRCREEAREG